MNEVQASPEEEQLFEEAMTEVGRLFFQDDKVFESSMAAIGRAPKPGVGVGQVAAQIISTVDDKMDLPGDFILPLLETLVPEVARAADEAGLIEVNDKILATAMAQGVKSLEDGGYEIEDEALSEAYGGMDEQQFMDVAGDMEALG